MNRTAVLLALLALIGGVLYLGWMQNSARVTQMSLNLGPAGAWQLAQPVSIPVLVASCFGGGFILGALVFMGNAMRLSRQVRRLEQQLAVSGGVESTAPEWR
jgi:uncharacterized membrane protein YciS (DUF1049 family)